jgi:branched-chain amino acid transport system substrate-binding protein
MERCLSRTVVSFVVVALLLAGTAGLAAAELRVGVLMPLTGKGAAYGQHQQPAIKMFLEDVEKAAKGVPFKLVTYDTRGENSEAVNLTRKLIHVDKVVAIVGPLFSAECEVAFPLAVQGKTPIVSPTTAKPGVAANNRPWAFRMALTTDKLNGPLIDKWVAANKGLIKNVVILTDTKDAVSKSDGTIVFPAVLKARNIAVLDNISFQTGDIDYSAQVTKVKSLNPDGIVVAGLYNEGGNVVREIRKQGLQQPIVGSLGMSDPKFIEIAGAAAEGVMITNDFSPNNPDPRVQKWSDDYRQRAGVQANNPAAMMYDTLHAMKACIDRSGVTGKPDDLQKDRDRIRGCFGALKDHALPIVGVTTINADGDAERSPVVLTVRNGRFELVK